MPERLPDSVPPVDTNDDWLNEGLQQAILASKPARTIFATPPASRPVAQAPEAPRPKPLGLAKGGIVRNSSTVHRRVEDLNPIVEPKRGKEQHYGTSRLVDKNDLPPEFGVPVIMTGMDANLEERTESILARAASPESQNALQAALGKISNSTGITITEKFMSLFSQDQIMRWAQLPPGQSKLVARYLGLGGDMNFSEALRYATKQIDLGSTIQELIARARISSDLLQVETARMVLRLELKAASTSPASSPAIAPDGRSSVG
jgi:hypothetical protein